MTLQDKWLEEPLNFEDSEFNPAAVLYQMSFHVPASLAQAAANDPDAFAFMGRLWLMIGMVLGQGWEQVDEVQT